MLKTSCRRGSRSISRMSTFRCGCLKSRRTAASVALSSDLMRARYRESLREPKLVRTKGAQRYDFGRCSVCVAVDPEE